MDTSGVLLRVLTEAFHLEIAYKATDYEKVRLTVEDVTRPGLQIAGYMDHFEPMRLQVIGNAEASYLEKMDKKDRLAAFERIFSYRFPALLIARRVTKEVEQLAKNAPTH